MSNKTLVIGCSGTVGLDFFEVNKNKNILYYSRKKPDVIKKKNWRQISLDKKIIGLPNVKLVSPTYNTYNLITNPMCKAVVCISGTTGFENMLLKKPTILLSDMFYSELPHCFRVTDLSTIPDIIRLIESIDLDTKDCEYELIKLVSLLQKNSTYFKYGAMWILDRNVKTTPFLELMESKVKALIKKNGVN